MKNASKGYGKKIPRNHPSKSKWIKKRFSLSYFDNSIDEEEYDTSAENKQQ